MATAQANRSNGAADPVAARFSALSLADVVRARDAYHVHLLHLPNVFATAIGRYLVRNNDATPDKQTPEARLKLTPGARPERTLEQTSVQPWSWPCVLVFVDRWMTTKDIRADPDAMVPRRLYLPDGKVVPTCVVYAPPDTGTRLDDQHLSFPSSVLGGGYVCLTTVQGRERVGSIACLVTDDVKTYALSNRHVVGEEGTQLFTMLDGTRVPIGRTRGPSARRAPFAEVYPGWMGERVELAIDAGLLELDDVSQWTTQIFGVGQVGAMLDVSPESLTLDIIGTPVKAFGAASGALAGELVALFFRYHTQSGVEYVADVLIGPRDQTPLKTQPGDSGTLWVAEPEPANGATPVAQPIAMQWGGERFGRSDGNPSPYALATFLSTACRALDVDLVYDWNVGHQVYWGEVGHYTIGAKACELVRPPALRAYFEANQTNISFDLDDIAKGHYLTPSGTIFYPLADVPDRVWKQRKAGIGRPHEGPNHFADMDDPLEDGATLLSRFEDDPASLTPAAWVAFYEAKDVTPSHMGLLPFRVGQLYQVMLDELGKGATDRALCAAGVMAHYVGDACQPLHVSRFHDGRPDKDEAGVHSAYETTMVTRRRKEIISGLEAALKGAKPRADVKGRAAVEHAVAKLMQRSIVALPPERICDVWTDSGHDSVVMWTELGQATIARMADGCRTLAMIWSSAWAEAGKQAPAATAADRDTLKAIYSDAAFAPSQYLPAFAGVPANV